MVLLVEVEQEVLLWEAEESPPIWGESGQIWVEVATFWKTVLEEQELCSCNPLVRKVGRKKAKKAATQ